MQLIETTLSHLLDGHGGMLLQLPSPMVVVPRLLFLLLPLRRIARRLVAFLV